jgi:hypothetical protein
MAVISGLSVETDRLLTRSPWSPSLPLALGLVLFFYLLNAKGLPLLADPDTQWHIAVGNWMLAHGMVPRVDVFSYTFAGKPWIAKEWLSQILLAGAYDIGGFGGVVALAATSISVTFALLLRLLLRDIKPLPALMFAVAAVVMMAPHFLARPYVFAFPLMLLWVAGLVRAVEERRAPSPILLVAMLLWANLHGGFTLGLMLAGAFALEALVGARDTTERKTLFFAWAKFGVAAGLVSCITPYGAESILVTLRIFNLGDDALRVISEWKSPDFHSFPTQEVVLLVALYVALSRGLKLPILRLLIVLALTHLYLRYARNAELLATLAPLAIAPLVARQWPSVRADLNAPGRFNRLARPAGAFATALAAIVAAIWAGGMIRYADISTPGENSPRAALDYARHAGLTQGRVFNHYGFGGYLIREGIPTFIDGRGELFGGEFIKTFAESVALIGKQPLEELLDRWQVDWTLLAAGAPANRLLAHLPGWRQAYRDDDAVIFVRTK